MLYIYIYIYIYTYTHTLYYRVIIQSWSELLAPLVNMIKGDSENKPALLIILIFYKNTQCTMKYTAVFLMLWVYISAGGPGHLV